MPYATLKTCSPGKHQVLVRKRHTGECLQLLICCALLTWWLWRGGCTRSHSEHGRETPLRPWYFVLRRGRVGRCQVCQTQQTHAPEPTVPKAACENKEIFSERLGPSRNHRAASSGLLLLMVGKFAERKRNTGATASQLPRQTDKPLKRFIGFG